MEIQTAINQVINKQDLSGADMQSVMYTIMQGEATPAQIGGLLVALRMKGETVEEITAAATVMHNLSAKVSVDRPHLVDIVGTGGDGSNTFNISTTSAFVIAAAGGCVAKHNNRSISSKSGSADVLEAAGVNIELTPRQVTECINDVGIGFMFAVRHHSAMKHAIGPRKELGTRTIFNMLGPLTNPAAVPNLLVGVYSNALVLIFAEVLQMLGSQHVMVVHSDDGLDEISIAAPTHVAELKNGNISTYSITPEQFSIETGDISDLKVSGVQESLDLMHAVLDNKPGPAKNIVLLNAGVAIYTADVTTDIETGIKKAEEVIANGTAKQKLNELIALTNDMTKVK